MFIASKPITLLLLLFGLQATHAACTLDIDNNGQQDALTDGLLNFRHQSGLAGSALVDNAIGANAQRANAGDISAFLNSADCQTFLDADGNQAIEAQNDGILALRFLFGFRGAPLIQDAVAGNAARKTPDAIAQWFVAPPGFSKQVVDDGGLGQAHAVASADFNKDGQLDLVATDFLNGKVYWYENIGNKNFTKRTVDDNLAGAYPTTVADVNKDGFPDVLANGFEDGAPGAVVWYENNKNGGFIRHNVDIAFVKDFGTGPHSIEGVDLDKDGDIDLLVSTQLSADVLWYENDGNNQFTKHVIDAKAFGSKYATAADLNGDGHLDVTAVHFFEPNNEQVTWYENDGNQNFTEHKIGENINDMFGAYYVSTSDVDGDNDIDVLVAVSKDARPDKPVFPDDESIFLYRNNGAGQFSRETIDPNAPGARSVVPADIDNDGDDDLVSGHRLGDTVAWYRNDGSGHYTKLIVDQAAKGAYGVEAADMDGDGDLDILSVHFLTNSLVIYYQQ